MPARSARLTLLFVLLSAAAYADTTSPVEKTAKAARPVGYIVPAAKGGDFYFYTPIPKFWTATQADVDRLESRLPDRLKTERTKARDAVPLWKRLGDYGRQYVGFVDAAGKRKILIELFFLRDDTRQHMTEGAFRVKDGGVGFCRITYDVASASFSGFGCNGDG